MASCSNEIQYEMRKMTTKSCTLDLHHNQNPFDHSHSSSIFQIKVHRFAIKDPNCEILRCFPTIRKPNLILKMNKKESL